MHASRRIAGLVGLFLLVAVPASAQLVISEFRVRGPSGAGSSSENEYVELVNNTASNHTVVASSGTGYGLASSDGVVRCSIPNGTAIPARGRFLCVNSDGYALASYPAGNGTTATGDATFTTDIPDNAGIALFSTDVPANFSLATRLDAVGSTSEANTLYKEGTGYPAIVPFGIDAAFARDQCGKQGSTSASGPCPNGGAVADSNDNAVDFIFVDTNGTSAGAGQRLGAPGPQNLSSPLTGTASMPVARLDPCVSGDGPPNRVRDFTSDPANNSMFGTLDLRATYTNNTGVSLTRLRFRIIDQATFPAPSGTADLRPRTSTDVVSTVDRAPCGSGTSNVTVNGTTLEQPPSQPNGGGFNSTLSVNDVTLATPLANGASIDVRFLFGIQQPGAFKVALLAETLPVGTSSLLELSGCTDCLADLGVTKTDGVTTAVPGGAVTYTITASNAGPGVATGATVADVFPASLTCTWTCVGAGGGACTAAGFGNINDTVTLPAGGNVTYTSSCTIAPGATGSLSNTATVTAPASALDPDPANNSATDSDTLTPQADLAVTKTDGVTSAVPGETVTYTITASNAGPSAAFGATVADAFPASLTCAWTCVGAGGGTCTASGSGHIADSVNLPAGGSATYTASCTIAPGATGTLANTATAAAPAGVADPNPANNSATDSDTLTPQADLAVTKTDGVTTAVPGSSVTYTIVASNSGPSSVTGATVADAFPAALTCTWTCVGAAGGTCTAAGSGNISDTVALPASGSVTYTASCTIAPGATGSLINTATVGPPAGISDSDPANNTATDTDALVPTADLAITQTDAVTTATPGGAVTYAIAASNAGPSAVTGATVADTFPAALSCTWSCAGAGGGICSAAGAGHIGDTVTLPVGGSVTYTASCTIAPGATGSLANTATVSTPAGGTDPNPANNSATDTDTLAASADLAITKTDGVRTATPGGSVTYTIAASNAGPSAVTGATVADAFPAALTCSWSCAGAGGGICSAAGSGHISDTVTLPVGGSVTYTASCAIAPGAAGSLANTATVSTPAGGTDPNPANNSATDTDALGLPNDSDGDTMPDAWETFFGLDPQDPSDASSDPDGDGLTNAQEFAARRHPVGRHARYFAEGSTGFFDTSVALLNLSTTDTARTAIALLDEAGGVVSHQLTLGPRQRQTVSIDAVLGTSAAVAIIVESDAPMAADRFMTWGTSGVGASLDNGAPAPATTWYFAEGATGPFLLYYLFENAGTTSANVTVRYLVEGAPPVTTTHTLAPQSRTTIPVNRDDPALLMASTGSVITSDVAIVAERAMYVNAGGTLGGGSASAGSNALSTDWYFGEGSTGPFFHCFLALLNPGTTAATATVTYHMNDGTTASKAYDVRAEGRRTVYFNAEAADANLSALAHGPVWFTVHATQPILAERTMWWADWPWYEAHTAPGSTTSAVSWAVPEGRHGGPALEETYVLVGNTTTTAAQVLLTLIADTGTPSTREVPIAAGERLTLNIGNLFGLPESRFSVIVESVGTPAVPLAVDYARYRTVNGFAFAGGGAAPAIPVP